MLAGGFAGGRSLGMNRQYWGYAVAPMLPRIERDIPANHAMYWHDVIHDALSMYKRDGRLSMSVGDTGFGEDGIKRSQAGILFYEKHWAIYEGWFWEIYGTTKPAFVREREGVPARHLLPARDAVTETETSPDAPPPARRRRQHACSAAGAAP